MQMGIVMILVLFVITPSNIEGFTYDYQDETVLMPNYNGRYEHLSVEIPNYYRVYGQVDLEIRIPNGKCERRFKDIVITKECPSITTFVQRPASA